MHARVYRFHERVVVRIGDSKEFYLDAETAEEFCTAIEACAVDVATEEFRDSEFRTVEIEIGDNVTWPLTKGKGKP
jgi:hypothetical protein